jgi:hypothetical protein
MTSDLGYFAPTSPPPPNRDEAVPTGRRAFGITAGTLGVLLAPAAATCLAFAGAVVWSGCFLSCTDDPNPLGGAALIAGAFAAVAAGPVVAGVLLKRWTVAALVLGAQVVSALIQGAVFA